MAAENDKPSVHPVQLEELKSLPESMRNLLDANLEVVQDLKVRLTMSVGGAQLSIGELFALKEGAMLKLDKTTSEPVDIFLEDKLVARGELMVADDHFAIRITEIGAKA
jgi:flagellar motor switch protein FliN/FliY